MTDQSSPIHSIVASSLFIKTALRKDPIHPNSKIPTWVMRQAGRYLPEFRQVRSGHSFFQLCQTPSLAWTVTHQPLLRYKGLLDAGIVFSDILVVLQAIGIDVSMQEGKGIVIHNPLEDCASVEKLLAEWNFTDSQENLTRFHQNVAIRTVYEAVALISNNLSLGIQSNSNENFKDTEESNGQPSLSEPIPLIGFAGAPWTLMSYAMGSSASAAKNTSSGAGHRARRFLYEHPKEAHALLTLLTDLVCAYLMKQIESGASAVQLFESCAADLTPQQWRVFALPCLQRIIQKIKATYPTVPVLAFARSNGCAFGWKDLLLESEADVVSLDSHVCVDEVVAFMVEHDLVGKKTVQGNLDPVALFAPDSQIVGMTKEICSKLKAAGIHHIANLGHGMLPDHCPDKLRVFLEAVKEC